MVAIQTQRVTYFESLNTGSSPVLTTRVLTPSKVMTPRKDEDFSYSFNVVRCKL